VLLALLACVGEAPSAPPAASPLDAGWLATVTNRPEAFTELVDADRDAWVAVHRNDWLAAAGSTGPAGVRARAGLCTTYTVLRDIHAEAWKRLGEGWEALGTLPPGSPVPAYLVGAAEGRVGPDARGQDWAELVARWTPRVDATRAAAFAGSPTEPFGTRRAARLAAGSLEELRRDVPAPLEEEGAGSQRRTFWDPWHLAALARVSCAPEPTPEGLAGALFSAQLGAPGQPLDVALSAWGVAIPAGDDDLQSCREAARAIDDQLAAWVIHVTPTAPEAGRALLGELRLVDRTRGAALVQLATEALGSDRPRCALAYAELARDHADGRSITPVNSPTLYAVLAAANLYTGHTREALDALEVLVPAFPEVQGVDETVGDLAVLETLHRSGDSREN